MSLVKEVAGTLNLEREGLSRPQSSHHAPACTKEYGGGRCRLYVCRSGTQTVVQMGLLSFYFYFAVCHLKILPQVILLLSVCLLPLARGPLGSDIELGPSCGVL